MSLSGLVIFFTIVLAIFKATGLLAISWWIVFLPIILLMGYLFVIYGVLMFIAIGWMVVATAIERDRRR